MQDIITKVKRAPGNLFRSKGDISSRLNISTDEAAQLIDYLLGGSFVSENSPDKRGAYIDSSKRNEQANETQYKVVSPVSLTPGEISAMVHADGITCRVSNVWHLYKKGVWEYSIFVKHIASDFYTSEELKRKFATLIPEYKPKTINLVKSPDELKFDFYMSDLHAGAIIENSIFGSVYNKDILMERLNQAADRISRHKGKYEQFNIIVTGDQLDGYNAETTRGGHKLNSLSNKQQFDIYIAAMIDFYSRVLPLGYGREVNIINVDNSNHSGNGMSYIANTALKFWLHGNFPQVNIENRTEPIFTKEYGIHAFAYTHGKDEKYQKRPFPYTLNAATDTFLCDYFRQNGYSDKECHLIKGDLHQYGEQDGKFGRYLNLPAVIGGNDYSELNFGSTKPGALIEIVERNDTYILQDRIKFK